MRGWRGCHRVRGPRPSPHPLQNPARLRHRSRIPSAVRARMSVALSLPTDRPISAPDELSEGTPGMESGTRRAAGVAWPLRELRRALLAAVVGLLLCSVVPLLFGWTTTVV